MPTEIWLFVVGLMAAAIAYFLKRILDNVDRLSDDVSEMKPKLAMLWSDFPDIKKRLGNLSSTVGNLTSTVSNLTSKVSTLSSKVGTLSTDIDELKPKVDDLWLEKFSSSLSPRQLNEHGKEILEESGIKKIIEEKKDELLAEVRKINPTNKYDAEKTILEAVEKLPDKYPEIVEPLKEGAFQTGEGLDAVLYTGGIYLRNLIFSDLGFNLEDLENGETEKNG